jgi:DNA repair protein RecN (Recombination protein N)
MLVVLPRARRAPAMRPDRWFQDCYRVARLRYNRTGFRNPTTAAQAAAYRQSIERKGAASMLQEIRIQNFAIIDSIELTFSRGLNVITGETGAGKSIIIDAVELLLGGKADPSFIRSGSERAVVEGVFGLDERAQALLVPVLQREELIEGDRADELIITREVRSNGRSTARVNGVTVNLEVLAEIGEKLVDVHGQSAHLSLFKPAAHLDLLDRYANIFDARDALAAVVHRLNETRREIGHLLEDEAAQQRRADRLRREIEEIDAAELRPGEDDELKAERNRLSNSEQLARLSADAYACLYGSDDGTQMGAVDQLMNALGYLQKLTGIDPAFQEDLTLAEEAAAQADELATSLRHYMQDIEFNPARLNELEERLELIGNLKRRYGLTIELVLEYADKARAELDGIEHSEERLSELRRQEGALLRHIGELAERISRARQAASRHLAAGIVNELADLRMASARFEVMIEQREDASGCFVGNARYAFDQTGIDGVEFLMSANPGEPLRPLAKVASGGEAARIMLALKRVLTAADQTPTLIFDEIDQGIGGRVGTVVGEKLWGLTGEHQVMVVTHLAQLAGFADSHYRVVKLVDGGRTRTQILPLAGDDQRAQELAAMLGTMNESGVQSARELLHSAQTYKHSIRGGGRANGQAVQAGDAPGEQPRLL